MEHGEHLRLFMGTVPQTAINTKTKENEIGYIKDFEVPFLYNPELKEVLVVGLAGGYMTKNLTERYDINVRVVEIEPKMLDLARKYFYWENEAEVYFDDGRHFLRNTGNYDVIIIDLGQVFPAWHLFTLEAFQEYKQHLNSEGFLVFNIFSAREGDYSKLTQTLYRTLQEVFYDIIILGYPGADGKETQGMVFLASKEEIDEEKIPRDVLTLNLDKDTGLTTDDRPLAEFYDYINWQDWGKVGKNGLKYFLY
jgi:spermidine synthase